MKITYYGHSCFGIETKRKHILVDPFISGNNKASHIIIDEIKADYILLTHGHQDHILDVERIAGNNEVTVVSNFEVIQYFGQKGINGHAMNHGGIFKAGFGKVKMVSAIHSSSFPDGSYAGNPAGFIMQNDEGCIYIAGDTCASMDMQLIPSLGYKLDLSIMPIGDTFTMSYQEASFASELVKCDKVIGCHYDTFPPIEIDEEEARLYFQDKGQDLILMNIGETINV